MCRASAPYETLLEAPEYDEAHRAERGTFYTDRVIHSPGAPVFRDDRGALLEAPEAAARRAARTGAGGPRGAGPGSGTADGLRVDVRGSSGVRAAQGPGGSEGSGPPGAEAVPRPRRTRRTCGPCPGRSGGRYCQP
ncbi:TIGR02452 family protein [Streptomyces sp. NPDC059072]|uniref:TIGR02452 family protein n=1 Tax=Streptomyces sp. NPDC059072 TaxID=3346715 RepID=UPI0036B95D7F